MQNIDWSPLKNGIAEHAVNYFLDVLWTLLLKHIPRKEIQCTKSIHPWLNARCRGALVKKNNAEGTEQFTAASDACGNVLREEREKYVEQLKKKWLLCREAASNEGVSIGSCCIGKQISIAYLSCEKTARD